MLLLLRNQDTGQVHIPFVPTGSFIGYGVEDSFNSLVSPTVYIPATRMDFTDTLEYEFVNNLRRNLAKDTYTKGNLGYTGTMETVLSSSGMGGIIRSLMGCDRPTGTAIGSNYSRYVFQPQYQNGPSLSFVVNTETSVDTGVVVRRSGAIVNSLAISSSFGELVSARTELVGTESILGEIVDFSPNWINVDEFSFTDVSVLIDDVQVDDVKAFELIVSNGIEPLQVVRNSAVPSLQMRPSFDVQLSMDIGLENSDYWTYLKDSQEVKVQLNIDNQTDSFVVDMVRMLVSSSQLPVEASTKDNTQRLELVALGGTFAPVQFTLEARYF